MEKRRAPGVTRLFPVHPGGVLLLIGVLIFPPAPLEAKVLRHGPTKFSVRTPSGYRLSSFKGIYTVRKGRDSATIMRISSPHSTSGLASSLVRTTRMKSAKIRGGGSRRVITGTVRGKSTYFEIEGRGPTFKVMKYVTRKKSRSSAKRFDPLTARDVAFLRTIARSARGGVLAPFVADIPFQRFSQGGSTALVPTLPGWRYSGAAGGMDGSRVGQGFFSLGIFFPGVASFPDPAQVIVNDWPRIAGGNLTITNIQFINGTAGVLGPGFNSATYTVRLVSGGISYDAIMTSGVSFNRDWYFSVVAVRTGSFPGLGQALMATWASWDASANRQSRTAATIASIRTTPSVAIDRTVFDRINSAWVEYIRR